MTDTNVLPDLPHDVKEIPTLSSIDSTRLRNITRNYLINTETWNFGHFSRLVYQAPEFSGDNDQVRRRVSAKNLWEEALNDFANGSNGSLKQKAVNELLRLHPQTKLVENNRKLDATKTAPFVDDFLSRAPPPAYEGGDSLKLTKRKLSELGKIQEPERYNAVKKSRGAYSSYFLHSQGVSSVQNASFQGSPMSICSTETSNINLISASMRSESPSPPGGCDVVGGHGGVQEEAGEAEDGEEEGEIGEEDEDESDNLVHDFESELFGSEFDSRPASISALNPGTPTKIRATAAGTPDILDVPTTSRPTQKSKQSTSITSSLRTQLSAIEHNYTKLNALRSRMSLMDECAQTNSRSLRQEISSAEDRLGADVRLLRMDVDRLEKRVEVLERRLLF